MVFGIISENTNINKVKIPEAIATELSPYSSKVCAPTPAAPNVWANVFNVRIAARGRLMFSLKRSKRSPWEAFCLDKIDEYERVFRLLNDDLKNNTTVDFRDTPIFKNSSWIKNTFQYLREGKVFPKETDLLHFYNSYYDVNHEDHEQVLEIIKYNFSQLGSEEREV